MYILDTSAFRSIPFKKLDRLNSEGYELFASTYCFWELLTHIDESDKYKRFRNNLMKFQYVKVFDDAYDDLYKRAIKCDSKTQLKISDQELIIAALAGLQNSDDLDVFYGAFILDSEGSNRKIDGVAKRARKYLEEREKRYITFLNKLIEALRNHDLPYSTYLDKHNLIMQLIDGEVLKFLDFGADKVGLKSLIINETYIYFSYILHQAIKYLEFNKSIDPNDFEDSQVSLCLKLDADYTLVTQDESFRESIGKTAIIIQNNKMMNFKGKLEVVTIESLG